MDIEKLINEYPNDMELGTAIRLAYHKNRESMVKLNTEMKDVKIFESPNGGKTVYVRGWGQNTTERKLYTNQLNLFDETN